MNTYLNMSIFYYLLSSSECTGPTRSYHVSHNLRFCCLGLHGMT